MRSHTTGISISTASDPPPHTQTEGNRAEEKRGEEDKELRRIEKKNLSDGLTVSML